MEAFVLWTQEFFAHEANALCKKMESSRQGLEEAVGHVSCQENPDRTKNLQR